MRTWIVLFCFASLGLAACGDGSNGAATPTATGITYRVTVSFNETVQQADIDEVGDILRSYDPDVDYLVQESFPPTGVATLTIDDERFCDEIVPELEAKSYVRSASCGPAPEPGDGNADEPVTNDAR